MMSKKVEIQFDEIVVDRASAWLLRFDKEEIWMPKSLCIVDERNNLIEVPMWLVEKHELESYIVGAEYD